MSAARTSLMALSLLSIVACDLDPEKPSHNGKETNTETEQLETDDEPETEEDEPVVKADMLRSVQFEGGGITQLNTTDWSVKTDLGSAIFTEISRDEWSVYLDNNVGGSARLDLWTGEIFENDAFVVDISAANPDRADGWSGTNAAYDGGGFVQLTDSLWVENNAYGPHYWAETDRDEWSISLYDASRDVSMVLDLGSMETEYREGEGEARVVYTITDANPEVVDAWLAREVMYAQGRFVQVDYDTWHEHNSDGDFVFEEYARDEWSVYLYDYDRGMRIQLDLSREVVSFSWEVSGEMTDIYNITAAR